MNPEQRDDISREHVIIKVDTKEVAVALVKDFWRNHSAAVSRAITLPDDSSSDEWTQELTAGDRTSIKQGRLPADKGQWFVYVSGNHQQLSDEAEDWLRGKGY